MYPYAITKPVPLTYDAFGEYSDNPLERTTLAAYLLVAGLLYVEDDDEDHARALPPPEDLEALGILHPVPEQIAARQLPLPEALARADPSSGTRRPLAQIAARLNRDPNPMVAASLVALGCQSGDELIRVSALCSAFEFFDPDTIGLSEQIAWFYANAREPETLEMLNTLVARVTATKLAPQAPESNAPAGGSTTGLIAVHGTVPPFPQSQKPEWSIPPGGSLFTHIQTFRSDIYGHSDYFRWEGGYTDWARNTAIQHLHDWVQARSMNGTDVVAHSHGCNVVMGSTALGSRYGKIVLLSCPYHWSKYNLPAAQITGDVYSVRIRFDFTVLLDRGAQTFPPGTLHPQNDIVLPFWFLLHSTSRKPVTWASQNLDRLLQ